MLSLEQRLGLAVAPLLAEIGADRTAAMMQDHRARTEGDVLAGVKQPPADVDIVARGTELRIEAADLLQRWPVDRHVAAGHVLGDPIGHEHVRGPAWGIGDASRHCSRAWGQHVGPADGRVRT